MNYLCFVAAVLITTSSAAQAITNSSGTYTSITIYDPYQAGYTDISGSPYIPEKGFAPGFVTVAGRAPQALKVRYNTEAGQLEYLEKSNVLRMTTPASEFRLVATPGDTLLFRTGFTGKGDMAKPQYCQVVYDGKKTTLIRSVISTIKKETESMSSDFGKQRFVQREQYYLLTGGEMASLTSTKSSLLGAFPASQKEAATAILNKQAGKIKNWGDVKQVLIAYDQN